MAVELITLLQQFLLHLLLIDDNELLSYEFSENK
jgi:hypothetical protein